MQQPIAYDSPKQIALLLKERGLSLKKRFGQNFLVSPGARQKIVALLAPKSDQRVWEIGPGIGSLTHMLLELAGGLVAFEIDHGLVRILDESLGARSHLRIVSGDYLKTWRGEAASYGLPHLVVGNLPYNAAAPIIATLIEWEQPVARAVFTVQREVAKRMAAKPRTKDYSGFSLICQSLFEVRLHGDIAAPSFHPVPEVTSTIVSLAPNGLSHDYDRELYGMLVRDLFAARRKTIRNNLSSGVIARGREVGEIEGALRTAGIDPGARGEELSVLQLRRLTSALDRSGSRESRSSTDSSKQ
jgi:16S rRNA (adenine1518-N6/adenine1519-N6)-dimethyltransferase